MFCVLLQYSCMPMQVLSENMLLNQSHQTSLSTERLYSIQPHAPLQPSRSTPVEEYLVWLRQLVQSTHII
jgi:hypothetical protein